MGEFLGRFPATLELAICAMIFALVIGLPAGVVAALKRGTVVDHGVMGTALTGYSMPIFWWGLILIMFFSAKLGWTPVSGRIAVEYDIPHAPASCCGTRFSPPMKARSSPPSVT